MKRIPLSQGEHAIVDDCDHQYLNQWKWYCRGGYAVRMARKEDRRTTIRMHRVVCERKECNLDGLHCDHRDGNRLNNTRDNVRPATCRQNKQNERLRKDSLTGFKGVCRHARKRHTSKPYQARIAIEGRRISLGYFHTAEEAHEAYKKAASEHFGDYASP